MFDDKQASLIAHDVLGVIKRSGRTVHHATAVNAATNSVAATWKARRQAEQYRPGGRYFPPSSESHLKALQPIPCSLPEQTVKRSTNTKFIGCTDVRPGGV